MAVAIILLLVELEIKGMECNISVCISKTIYPIDLDVSVLTGLLLLIIPFVIFYFMHL